jgi:hypothetical protein
MYVMQSLPSHQQGLAGGIFNTMIRLCSTVALGISTAVFGSVELAAEAHGNPMLPYTRAFQVSVAMAAFGLVFVPFTRVGTQGNHKQVEGEEDDGDDEGHRTASSSAPPGAQATPKKEAAGTKEAVAAR